MRYTPYVSSAESDRCRHDRNAARASLRSLNSVRVIYALQRLRARRHRSYCLTNMTEGGDWKLGGRWCRPSFRQSKRHRGGATKTVERSHDTVIDERPILSA